MKVDIAMNSCKIGFFCISVKLKYRKKIIQDKLCLTNVLWVRPWCYLYFSPCLFYCLGCVERFLGQGVYVVASGESNELCDLVKLLDFQMKLTS